MRSELLWRIARAAASALAADSDGDGLLDGAEVHTHGSNPTDADSDGDGLTDPATGDGAASITIFNAASSHTTLKIMLIIAAAGMPFVLAYSAVIYWAFRGKVELGEHSY